MQQSLQYISRLFYPGTSHVTTIKSPTGRVSMNPVVVSILIFSNLQQNVPIIFNTEIPMQTLSDFYCYLYIHCYIESILMCV